MLGKLKRLKRVRTHGFLKRMSTPNGKNVVNRRRAKGRHQLTVKVRRVKTK